ncbi:MAG: secretin N-terminal domain-containing protein [Planctomycetota bacterium]
MPNHPTGPAAGAAARSRSAAYWLLLSVSAVAIVACAAPLQAGPKLPAPGANGVSAQRMPAALARRGDLTLRDSSLEAALFTISELWGINIVAGEIPGSVNGVFKDAPLREILDSILLSNGYAYRPVGESLVVSRLQDLGQINPFFISATIPVGAAEVGEVVDAARLMTTPQGQVRAMPSARAVLVVDFADRVEKIRDLVKQIDTATRSTGQRGTSGVGPQRLEVAYFRTHFVPAADAQVALNVVLSPQGRIAAIDNEDRLLVVDYAENLSMVEAVLSRIDRPRPQVKIQALIYDINLTDIEEIGVNWNALTSGSLGDDGAPGSGDGGLFNTVTKAPFDAAGTGGTFTFFSLNADFNLQAVVLALQQADDSRLLASPNVTVIDNEEATFQSVSEIPFQQLTQTGAGGQIGTTSFRDAGITLKVTPKVANDRSVDMKISPEFSRLTGFTPGDNQPIIDRRTATTRVRVQNGQTLMIGGLRQRNDVGDFDGVPLLKDLRYVGHLFRARETQIQESELVVFITPEIVGYSDPLSPRDRLATDTVQCRLDRIPAPEGCPPCNACGTCQPNTCGPVITHQAPIAVGQPNEVIVSEEPISVTPPQPSDAAPAVRFTPGPTETETIPPDEPTDSVLVNPAATTPPTEPITPTVEPPEPSQTQPEVYQPATMQPTQGTADAVGARLDRSPRLEYPLVTQRRLRRLPPVGRSLGAGASGDAVAPMIAAAGPSPAITPAAVVPLASPAENPLRKSYDQRFRASGSLNTPRVASQPEADPAPGGRKNDRGRRPAPEGLFWR